MKKGRGAIGRGIFQQLSHGCRRGPRILGERLENGAGKDGLRAVRGRDGARPSRGDARVFFVCLVGKRGLVQEGVAAGGRCGDASGGGRGVLGERVAGLLLELGLVDPPARLLRERGDLEDLLRRGGLREVEAEGDRDGLAGERPHQVGDHHRALHGLGDHGRVAGDDGLPHLALGSAREGSGSGLGEGHQRAARRQEHDLLLLVLDERAEGIRAAGPAREVGEARAGRPHAHLAVLDGVRRLDVVGPLVVRRARMHEHGGLREGVALQEAAPVAAADGVADVDREGGIVDRTPTDDRHQAAPVGRLHVG